MNIRHLTDEQFSELLAGESCGDTATLHLESCDVCRDELRSMQTAVGTLRDLSLRWAEKRAVRIAAPSPWLLGWYKLPGWGAATALLFFGLALGVHVPSGPPTSVSAIGQAQTATVPSDDELAEDNQLLRSIDQELNRQVRPLVPASELTVSHPVRHHGVREVAN
ncbi:MAG TPA: hypothetical protein VHY48_07780 [Acidobacteriaceae bacterium]|jgi:hypothetical protein|nr:hypothetical protein [Acidobacteriaceae bacterium]